MRQLKDKRISTFLIGGLILALLLGGIYRISPALGAYIGPNRTVTETVQDGEGWGRECQQVAGSYRWVTTTTCNGCNASCANRLENQYPDSNPSSICNAAYLGSKVHDYSCSTVEREITYQPAAITSSVSCAQTGSGGWCRSEAVVSLLGSEGPDACGAYSLTGFEDNQANTAPASGCSAAASFTFTNSGIIDYLAWVHSSLGDTSTMTRKTVKIDRVPPALRYTQADLFTLILSGTDAHSGVDRFEVNINGAGWAAGAEHTLMAGVNDIEMRVFDRAGNVTSDRVVIVTDSSPPEILEDRIAPAAPDGSQGWYVTPPTISVSAQDSQTGIAFAGIVLGGADYEARSGYTVTSGQHAIQIKAVDGAGNQRVEAPASFANPLQVDPEPPELVVEVSPGPVSGDWYDQVVVLDAGGSFDAVSGLELIEIDLDGKGFIPASSIEIGEGMHSVRVRASDEAGNQASGSYTINVDLTPPYAHPVLTGPEGPGGSGGRWFGGAVRAAANPGDASGGDLLVEGSADGAPFIQGDGLSFSGEGAHTAAFRVTDPVGREAVETVGFGIDLTPPEILISSHTDGETIRDRLLLAGTAFDGLSGIYQVELKVGEGAWDQVAPQVVDADAPGAAWAFDLSLASLSGGPASFTLRAMDRAGNYSPERTISLVVNNRAARLEIPERWMVGLTVIPRHVRGDTGGVERAVAAISHPRFGAQTIPLRPADDWAISWNGTFDDGQAWAPPGEYTVVVTAWDAYGNAAKDRGVIFVPELPDGPVQIAPERVEVYGVVQSLEVQSVDIDGVSYQISAASQIAPGIEAGVRVYGEADKLPGQTEIVWLKPAVEVPIYGRVDALGPDGVQVDGQRYDLTAESSLPDGLVPGLIVEGTGLDDGRGVPDIVWLALVSADPVPFSGKVTAYGAEAVLSVDGVGYHLTEETVVVSKTGLAVGDEVEGWYLEDGFRLVSVREIEPLEVAFAGTVGERTATAVVVDGEVYRITEASVYPEELSAGHLVEGSALLFKDGHLELIEASILPGGGSALAVRTEGAGEGGGTALLRLVSRWGAGLYAFLGLLLGLLLWLLLGRRYAGTVIAVDGERRQFTLRLSDEVEDPRLRVLGYHQDLETAVRLNQGKRVLGRIVLFRARTMRQAEE